MPGQSEWSRGTTGIPDHGRSSPLVSVRLGFCCFLKPADTSFALLRHLEKARLAASECKNWNTVTKAVVVYADPGTAL